MFFSIVVPTLNEEKYLPTLLSSLVSQTNKEFEVIISDGKSEDKTEEKALEFKDRLNLKVYGSDKRNVCYQRNLGAKKAKADSLIFIDADHWVNNDFIETIFRRIKDTQADVIIPQTIYVSKKLFWKGYSVLANWISYASFFIYKKKPFGSGPTVIFKKNFFEKIGGYESLFYFEDHRLLEVAREHNAKMYFFQEIKLYSSTRRMNKTGILKFLYMHFRAIFHFAFVGPIKDKIFEFEAGGQAHEK